MVVNLTEKTDYVNDKFECRYNFFLTVLLKKLVKIENIVSRTFSIQLVIILPS